MNCPQKYCKKGYHNCCLSCNAYEVGICENVCALTEECPKYTGKDMESKKEDRIIRAVFIIMFVLVMAFAIGMYCQYQNYIQHAHIKKELMVAPNQFGALEGATIFKNTYSIPEMEGMSNDQ